MSLFAHRKASPLPLRAFDGPDLLTSPFEDWCGSQGIHPEAFGAWESFQATAASPAGDTPADLGRGPVIA
jgi:hypothetical protein